MKTMDIRVKTNNHRNGDISFSAEGEIDGKKIIGYQTTSLESLGSFLIGLHKDIEKGRVEFQRESADLFAIPDSVFHPRG